MLAILKYSPPPATPQKYLHCPHTEVLVPHGFQSVDDVLWAKVAKDPVVGEPRLRTWEAHRFAREKQTKCLFHAGIQDDPSIPSS